MARLVLGGAWTYFGSGFASDGPLVSRDGDPADTLAISELHLIAGHKTTAMVVNPAKG